MVEKVKGNYSGVNKVSNRTSVNYVKKDIDVKKIKDDKIDRLEGDFSNKVSLDKETLNKIVEETNQVIEKLNRQVKVEVDSETNMPIVKVINKETGEVLRQYPPEELQKFYEKMKEFLGLIVDKFI